MELTAVSLLILVLVVPASFVLSSSAGLGGSLILVPALVLALGTKEGIALAALLLAVNNLAKIGAYRQTIPFSKALMIALAVMIGAVLGASLMIMAPESWVRYAVILALLLTFASDFLVTGPVRRLWALLLALTSGATSGFSGTSGPLKGVAIRSLQLPRQYFVGAASLVSLVGDVSKAAVFTYSGLLDHSQLLLAAVLVPVMIVCTLSGRHLNQKVGEKGFAILFWSVMAGYTFRLVFAS